MARLRLNITKEKEIRYISHLDYARTFERVIRRSRLPAAYSEGFNPHMKLAFASALALGVTSDAEYLDIELTSDIDLAAAVKALVAQLPEGISIKEGVYVAPQTPALMAAVNLATYQITVPYVQTEQAECELQACIEAFNHAGSVIYVKDIPKKGKKEIDAKLYVNGVDFTVQNNTLVLSFAVNITPTGSIKPAEVLDILVSLYHLPIQAEAALIHRTGLYIVKDTCQKTPMEA